MFRYFALNQQKGNCYMRTVIISTSCFSQHLNSARAYLKPAVASVSSYNNAVPLCVHVPAQLIIEPLALAIGQSEAIVLQLGIVNAPSPRISFATIFVPRDATRKSWPMMKQCSTQHSFLIHLISNSSHF